MEKRFYLGVGILVLFLALGLLSAGWMDKANESVTRYLQQAIRAEDISRGAELAQKAADQWQQSWKCLASIADHGDMDEIDSLFAQLQYYASEKCAPLFNACCARVQELVEAVADTHRLTWWNLL